MIEKGLTVKHKPLGFGLMAIKVMLDAYAYEFVLMNDLLQYRSRVLRGLGDAKTENDMKQSIGDLAEYCATLLPKLESLDLDVSVIQCRRVIAACSGDGPTDAIAMNVAQFTDDLLDRINDELYSRKFFYVKPGMCAYYEQNIVGSDLVDILPEAIYDSQEAGKCLALERHTAAAFHLMRVAERAINKYMDERGLKMGHSWGACLKTIREYAVNEADIEKKKRINAVHARVAAIKDAWRDDTMHVQRNYQQEEVLEVLVALRGFLRESNQKEDSIC